ncbi:MAG: alanine racemase [Candidatus Omnitrophota bacterium]
MMDSFKKEQIKKLNHPVWAEVDLGAVGHNFRAVQKCLKPATKVLCVVKAQAYGHGMIEAAKLLDKKGTHLFGVADIDEGILLRKAGTKKPILVFENILPQAAATLIKANLTATICNIETAQALNSAARNLRKKISVHIKIDTGMGRLGVWHEKAVDFILKVRKLESLNLEGIYTHFPSADTDKAFTQKQIKIFSALVEKMSSLGIRFQYVHAANSAGIIGYPAGHFNLVRAGLMLYGMYPDKQFYRKVSLRPALAVKSKVIFVKEIKQGMSISYGRSFIAKTKMKTATLPIGYSDGYFRLFSNAAFVLINGKRCPVLGRVTMDQIVVDVTRLKSVKVGDEVVLLGRQGKYEITADNLASFAQTINYEITCSLGSRLRRFYK